MSFDYCVRPCLLAVGAVFLLASCSSPSHSPQIAYRDAESERPLEVPPDLKRPESAGAVNIPVLDEDEQLMPRFRDIELVRAGPNSWLEIRDGDPAEIWPQVKAYLRSEGLEVRSENPLTGSIETGWARRYESPERTGLSGFIDRFFGGGDLEILDRYQFRLERMEDGTGTRVFVTHWMVEDQPRQEGGGYQQHSGFEWQRMPGDPAVVTEMQRRLLVYIGVREERARRVLDGERAGENAQLPAIYEETDGVGSVTLVEADDERIWPRVGDSLNRLGAAVDEADADRGIYRIAWVPPGDSDDAGLFSRVFGGGEEATPRDYVIRVQRDNGVGRVWAADASEAERLDPEGDDLPASGVAEKALLQRLADALNGTLTTQSTPVGRRDEPAEAPTGGGTARGTGPGN